MDIGQGMGLHFNVSQSQRMRELAGDWNSASMPEPAQQREYLTGPLPSLQQMVWNMSRCTGYIINSNQHLGKNQRYAGWACHSFSSLPPDIRQSAVKQRRRLFGYNVLNGRQVWK
jgi:hypothetical protein